VWWLGLDDHLQVKADIELAAIPLRNVRNIGHKIEAQYEERRQAYFALDSNVENTCSSKFQLYMSKRGHRVGGRLAWLAVSA
jgi:hypothetical protein